MHVGRKETQKGAVKKRNRHVNICRGCGAQAAIEEFIQRRLTANEAEALRSVFADHHRRSQQQQQQQTTTGPAGAGDGSDSNCNESDAVAERGGGAKVPMAAPLPAAGTRKQDSDGFGLKGDGTALVTVKRDEGGRLGLKLNNDLTVAANITNTSKTCFFKYENRENLHF